MISSFFFDRTNKEDISGRNIKAMDICIIQEERYQCLSVYEGC